MKQKIIWKLASCFITVLILFTLIVGTVFTFMFRQHTISISRTSIEKKALSIAQTLSDFESGEISKPGKGQGGGGGNGYGAYLRFLDELAMAEVWIVDKNLNALTTSHQQTLPSSELPKDAADIVAKVFVGDLTYGEEFSNYMDSPTLTVGAPIRTKDGIIGAVLVHSPASGVDEALRQGLNALFIGIIAALLFAVSAAILLSYGFTSPLQKIRRTALQLADGNYAAKTCVVQQDEIGQLAQTIDFLAAQLARAQTERESLEQLKQDFVANVSHELRTPVAVMRGSLEILKDGTINSPIEIQAYYEQMLVESSHLEHLINDLLDLSRLQSNQFPLDLSELNLCDVLRDVTRSIRMKAQEREIEIIAVSPDDACMITGDYVRIRQLLLILLDNAVKFSHSGKQVKLILSPHDSDFCITVTDYGIGIAPDDMPYIFDRFQKIHHAQNKNGTGLGLAIAKQIANRHNALLTVTSTHELTQFSIVFKKASAE